MRKLSLCPLFHEHLLSSYSFTLESHVKVMRIEEMIIKQGGLLIVKQILLISTLENVQRKVWRIYILMVWGAEG